RPSPLLRLRGSGRELPERLYLAAAAQRIADLPALSLPRLQRAAAVEGHDPLHQPAPLRFALPLLRRAVLLALHGSRGRHGPLLRGRRLALLGQFLGAG